MVAATARTSEFLAAVESFRLRQPSTGPEAKQRLLSGKERDKGSSRTAFTRQALQISKDLQTTTAKLEKLAQLAKQKSLFNDRPVEISELTYIIKRDIASLNAQIAQLQTLKAQPTSSASSNSKKPLDEHNTNVVMMLQGRLASASMGFKDVLEIRTQNMRAAKERGEVFGDSTNSAVSGIAGPQTLAGPMSGLRSRKPPADSPLYQTLYTGGQQTAVNGRQTPLYDPKGKGKAVANGDTHDFLALDMAGSGGATSGDLQQMQLVEQEDQYLNTRSTAIESIESTMNELGQIFQQLAQMVAQQGETVQRIDADTSDIANNVGGAQRELLRYYTNMSSNRMFMLKVFGVLIVFFLLFVLVT